MPDRARSGTADRSLKARLIDGGFAAGAASAEIEMAGPVKRSVMIAGHATSISLEPVFWDALKAAAEEAGLPLSALVARIDAERVRHADPPNLGSAIRVWLLEKAIAKQSQ